MATVDAVSPAKKVKDSATSFPYNSNKTHHTLLLTLTDGTNRRIEDLSQQTGYDKGELIDIAMTLLQLSLQAVTEGKTVGVAAPDQELELEFTGFHKDDPTGA